MRSTRRESLRELLERHDLGGVLLRRPANFAWHTNGADNRVDRADPLGVASILVTPNSEYVVTDNIEAERLRAEQTPSFEVVEHPWHEDAASLIQELTGDATLGADHPLQGALDLSAEIVPLRLVLDSDAMERYRNLGLDARAAVEGSAEGLDPSMTEREAASRLAAACEERGIFAPLAMAASERRLSLYRHPVPTDDRLGARAMLVVCAERGGLYANLTRFAEFEEPDEEILRRQRACEEILRRMREEATSPGRMLSDALSDCRAFYADVGFPEEWRLHHQGGITGYASREVVATPDSTQSIQAGQAFAWNPSITGAKAEETFLLTESGARVLT